jgi:hypothetical protein
MMKKRRMNRKKEGESKRVRTMKKKSRGKSHSTRPSLNAFAMAQRHHNLRTNHPALLLSNPCRENS